MSLGYSARYSAEYKAIHYQLARQRGRATLMSCVDCGLPAKDWSHIHNTDSKDLQNYDPRCRSCHIKYDNKTMCYGSKNGRSVLTEELVREAREIYSTGEYTSKEVAGLFGVAPSTMWLILRGRTWTHVA